MATTWTYPVTDLAGRIIVPHLPIRCDYFTNELGPGEGQISASIPLSRIPAGVDVDNVLAKGRRFIWPTKNGQPRGCYILTAEPAFTERSTGVKIVGRRWDWLLASREVKRTLVWRDVDQNEIVRDVLRYALGRPTVAVAAEWAALAAGSMPAAADIPWVDLDSSLSGRLRTNEDNNAGLQGANHKNVDKIIGDMLDLDDAGNAREQLGLPGSLDYRVDYSRDAAGNYRSKITLGYPIAGRTSSPVPFEYPGSIKSFSYAEDIDDTVTAFTVYGAGQGVEKVTGATAYDTQAHADGMPLLEGSGTSNASDQSTLDAAGRSGLAERRGVNAGVSVRLDKSTLGQYELGDIGEARLKHPRWGRLPRHFRFRIIGERIEPGMPGRAESIQPVLGAL